MNDLYADFANDVRYLDSLRGATILGIVGTNGAGKDSLMDMLERSGYLVYRNGTSIRELAVASLGSPNRGGNDSPSGRIGNAQRTRWPGGMVELGLIDWWARAGHLPVELRPKGLVVGSVRSMSEVKRLHEVGGKLICVDADVHIRYERNVGRKRADEHGITFDEFVVQEQQEMADGETDPTKFGMSAVMQAADVYIYNNGPIEDFQKVVADVLKDEGILL